VRNNQLPISVLQPLRSGQDVLVTFFRRSRAKLTGVRSVDKNRALANKIHDLAGSNNRNLDGHNAIGFPSSPIAPVSFIPAIFAAVPIPVLLASPEVLANSNHVTRGCGRHCLGRLRARIVTGWNVERPLQRIRSFTLAFGI
jgi:hypothetical protein